MAIDWDKTIRACYYSLITTSGFWIAFFFATILVYIIQKLANQNNVRLQHKTAKVGPIMMVVELIDAIPEAALLAETVSEPEFQPWTLVIAILFMNISNGLFTSFDVISVVDSPVNSIIMFIIMNYSTGMLCYAISVTIYGDFKGQWDSGIEHAYADLLALVVGTLIGSFFIFVVKYIHENHKVIINAFKHRFCSGDDDDDDESEEEMDPKFPSKKHLYEKAIWWRFIGRLFFSFFFLIVLSAWSVGLTAVCSILFDFLLSSNDVWASVMGAFLEGLGGGAFLGTIACTIIPELGKTYGKYSEKVQHATKISFSGLFFFIFGLLTSSIIDVAL